MRIAHAFVAALLATALVAPGCGEEEAQIFIRPIAGSGTTVKVGTSTRFWVVLSEPAPRKINVDITNPHTAFIEITPPKTLLFKPGDEVTPGDDRKPFDVRAIKETGGQEKVITFTIRGTDEKQEFGIRVAPN